MSPTDRAGPAAPVGRRNPPPAGDPAASAAGATSTLRGAALPIAVGAAWLALGLRSPHVTYHLAPVLGAASWPAALRVRHRAPAPAARAALAAGGGLGITLAVALVLAWQGALGGPSLWHGSGALETPLLAGIGALWGWRAASRPRPGLLGRVG